MLAYEPGIAVAYNVALTSLSLAVAVAVTMVGLTVAASDRSSAAAPIGGGIVGAGIAGMHYLGMSALELPGHLTWSADLVLASIALGIALAMAAAGWRRGAATGSRRSSPPAC